MTVINTNVKSLFAQASLRTNERALTGSMEQLSTGKRINSAKDDAAGLAIGMRMTADLRGIAVAIRNANDGISMMQTADGALGEVSSMLQRMRELAVQAATGSMSPNNRKALQAELDQLIAEVENVSKITNFNGIKLLDGSSAPVFLQTGTREGEQVQISIVDVKPKSLGLQGYAIEGQLTSGRVDASAASMAYNDVLFNGKPIFASSTVYAGGVLADTATPPAAITDDYAAAVASAVNSNVGQHRVQATAYNTLKGVAPTSKVFDRGDLSINGVEIGAAGGVEELVLVINRDAPGVTAVLGGDGSIELSNDTGEDIVIGGNAIAKAGFVAGTYTGYVTYTNLDKENITVIARSEGNGYASGAGAVSDVKALGLNESTDGSFYSGGMVGTGALEVDDDVRINGIRVGTSLDSSAIAKASTINLISDQTGVVATAFTEAQITVDISASAGATFSINGATVTIGGSPQSMTDIVGAINAAETGILASTDENGTLFLTSSGGSDIKVSAPDDSFIKSVKARSGEAALGPDVATGFTVKGRVSLTSETGAEIRVEAETAASLDKLGMAAQGGSSVLVGGALTITTQEAAGRALTKIDLAIEKVLLSRATLGAFQNRLLAAVDNLSTTSLNLTQSRSRIMDADYAQATTELARTQIVSQASTAMLAQANASQQSVLQLIQQ
jgi:flagellin